MELVLANSAGGGVTAAATGPAMAGSTLVTLADGSKQYMRACNDLTSVVAQASQLRTSIRCIANAINPRYSVGPSSGAGVVAKSGGTITLVFSPPTPLVLECLNVSSTNAAGARSFGLFISSIQIGPDSVQIGQTSAERYYYDAQPCCPDDCNFAYGCIGPAVPLTIVIVNNSDTATVFTSATVSGTRTDKLNPCGPCGPC